MNNKFLIEKMYSYCLFCKNPIFNNCCISCEKRQLNNLKIYLKRNYSDKNG